MQGKQEAVGKFRLRPQFNKNNGQFTFSLPKKQLPRDFKDKLPRLRSIDINIERFDCA